LSYIGNIPQSGAIRSQFFSGDGSTTTFNLSYEYGNEASVLVFITGVKQRTDSYAVINGQIVFSTAPPSATDNNANEISTNTTISDGYNGSSAGPLTVANNVTVTVSNNSTWTIF